MACASSTITMQPWRSATRDDRRKRREVTVHAEDRVGDDQSPRGAALPRARPYARIAGLQGVGVRVGVADDLGPGQATTVDQAGVVQLVREDHVASSHQRRDRPDVGLEAGGEDQGVLAVLERRDALLQPAVQLEAAGDQSRRTGARAELLERRPRARRRRPDRWRGRGSCSRPAAGGAPRSISTSGSGGAPAVGEHPQEVAVAQLAERPRAATRTRPGRSRGHRAGGHGRRHDGVADPLQVVRGR